MAVCILDTETTGFAGNPLSSVIELGAVVLSDDGKEELSSYSSYVQPAHPLGRWSAKALSVCKITPDMLVGAPPAHFVWEEFLSWLSLHKPVTSVLAFNKPFDFAMMSKTFPGATHLPWGDCLMRQSGYAIYGNRKAIKLSAVCAYAQIEMSTDHSHRAKYDAQITGRVYGWLQTRL